MEQEGRHLIVLDGLVDGNDLWPRVHLVIADQWYLDIISNGVSLFLARYPFDAATHSVRTRHWWHTCSDHLRPGHCECTGDSADGVIAREI